MRFAFVASFLIHFLLLAVIFWPDSPAGKAQSAGAIQARLVNAEAPESLSGDSRHPVRRGTSAGKSEARGPRVQREPDERGAGIDPETMAVVDAIEFRLRLAEALRGQVNMSPTDLIVMKFRAVGGEVRVEVAQSAAAEPTVDVLSSALRERASRLIDAHANFSVSLEFRGEIQ